MSLVDVHQRKEVDYFSKIKALNISACFPTILQRTRKQKRAADIMKGFENVGSKTFVHRKITKKSALPKEDYPRKTVIYGI